MKKQILSILLTLCMMLCLVPTGVFAEGETTEIVAAKQELVDALADDTALRSVAVQSIGPNEAEVELDLYEKMSAQVSVIKLISDIELSGSLRVDYAVTIDLNGHVLKMGDIGDGSVIKIESTGNLTVIDSDPNAPHKFKVNGTDSWVLDETSGTKTVNGGVIYGGKSKKGGGVCIEPGGEFTMTGGSIVGCTATGYIACGGGVYVAKKGTFTMTGGRIVGCTAVADEYGMAFGGGIRNDGEVQGDIGRTTLSGTAEIRDCHAKGAFRLYGGGISDAGTLTISGDVKIIGCTAGGMGSDAMYVNANDDSSITEGTFYGSIEDPGNKISGITVTYQINGGDYATQILQSGNAAKPVYPIIDADLAFEGWLKGDGTYWNFHTAVTENLTLTGWLYVPVTNETELKAALADDTVDIIRLTDDIDISSSLTILRKLTLDLNGHVLKMTGSGSVIILDDNNGTTTGDLTIIDRDPTAEHKFKVNGVEPWVLDDSGTEIVKGGVITGGNAENGGGVYVKKGGEFTMTAGNIVGCTAKYGGGLYLQESSFTMNGGSIVGCSSTMRAAGEPIYSGIFSTGTNNNVYKEKPNVVTLTGGLIKNNGRFAIDASYNTIIYANGGEIYGKVGVYQACKITGLAGHTGITAFRGRTEIKGASNIPENISHVDWGLFYGGLGISGDTTTGIIVTYKDGDNEYAKQVLPSAGLATCPDAPDDKTGYTFGGWKRADGTAWDYAKDTVTENITLYTKWIPHTYTVTFDSTGGSEVTTKTMTATYGKPLANMPVPRREGYVFLGWYDAMVCGKCYGDSDGNGTDAYDKDGNITLYAQWMEASDCNVRFETDGGTMTGPTEVWHKINTPIAKPSDPTKPGYTFTGWYTDSAFTQAWNFDDWVTGELRLYAGWTVNQYTITIKPENGEADTIITQDFGTAVTAPNLTKTGYTFMGWDKTFPTTMPAENVTITAQWKINQYTITFDTAGGSEIASITQDYGSAITAPANPTRKGYTFTGWDKEIPETMPAENITITAQWKDSEKPTGTIEIGENKWNSFLNKITFGMFFKDTQTVTITASDNGSGIKTVEYLISAKELTEAELSNAVFTAYTTPFGIDPDNEYIIYVRLTDTAGNVSYICSDGIVLDGTKPIISGIENGKIYCEAQTVTIDEKYIDTVTVNGTTVTLDENNSFVLSSAIGEQKIIVTDKSGNTAEMTVTVNNRHAYGEWVTNGNGTHTRKCMVDGCNELETKDCTGGKATCTEKAVCEVCGKAYGKIDSDNHANLKHISAKAATKHKEGNIEYWYCKDCGKYFDDAAATKEFKKSDTVITKLTEEQKSPKTDDNNNIMLLFTLLLISGCTVIGITIVSKKKKHNS